MSKSSTITKGVATPNRVTTHPGEVLREEFLKPLGMSVNALALALRVPATRIGAIVKGERSVTVDIALRLALFVGMSAEFWINPQAMHDLTKARMQSGVAIERDVRRGRPKSSGVRGTEIGEARDGALKLLFCCEELVSASSPRRRGDRWLACRWSRLCGTAWPFGKRFCDRPNAL